MTPPVLGVVGSAADGVELLRERLVAPLAARGWRVAVTLTPTAARWLADLGEIGRLEELTGLPVRSVPRLPGEPRPHPDADVYAVVPASANTVAKLALGLADNQALTMLCEAIGARTAPVVVCPGVNAAHAGHPAWSGHLDALRLAGVHLVYGEDVAPLRPPRSGAAPELPWAAVLSDIDRAVDGAVTPPIPRRG